MEYSIDLKKKIEQVCDYYEKHDSLLFLKRIMGFINESLDLIDMTLFLIPKEAISDFRSRASKIWNDDCSAEKLELLNKEYYNEVTSIISYGELMKMRKEFGAYSSLSWYLSNYHDDPTNQFQFEFIELFVFSLNKAGVTESEVERMLQKHFQDIIDTWTVNYSEYI